MMKILKSLPMLVLAVILIIFMVSNRQGISLSLFPLPYEMLVPAYLLLFLGIFIGIAIGAYVLAARRMRAAVEQHQLKREIARLNSKVGDLEAQRREQSPPEPSSDEEMPKISA